MNFSSKGFKLYSDVLTKKSFPNSFLIWAIRDTVQRIKACVRKEVHDDIPTHLQTNISSGPVCQCGGGGWKHLWSQQQLRSSLYSIESRERKTLSAMYLSTPIEPLSNYAQMYICTVQLCMDVCVPDNESRNIPEVVLVGRWAVGVLGIWRGRDSWVKGGANGVSLQATWDWGGRFLSQLGGCQVSRRGCKGGQRGASKGREKQGELRHVNM
jgi:hypothetical protein